MFLAFCAASEADGTDESDPSSWRGSRLTPSSRLPRNGCRFAQSVDSERGPSARRKTRSSCVRVGGGQVTARDENSTVRESSTGPRRN